MDNSVEKKPKKTRGQKKAFIVGIVSGILTAVSVAVCITASCSTPKAKDIKNIAKGSAYYALTNFENGDWGYGDESGNFYTYDSEDKLVRTLNLKEFCGSSVDLRADHIFREYDEDGSCSDICWLTTVSTSQDDSNYLVKVQKDKTTNSFTCLSTYKSSNTVDYVLPVDNYVYIVTWDTAQKTIIKRLNRNDISTGETDFKNGFLYEAKYTVDPDGEPCVDYTYRQKARVFSMAAKGDYIYAVTQNGVTKMNKDFSYNTVMTKLAIDYKSKTKHVKASQSEDNKEHIYFYYDDTGETVSKNYSEVLASTELSGGAYDTKLNKIIAPTTLNEVREVTPSDINDMITGEIIDSKVLKTTGISFSSRLRNADLHNALTYDPIKHKGLIEFQDSSTVALIDCEKNKTVYSFPTTFDVYGMIINDKTGKLYFTNRTSNVFGFASEDMAAMSKVNIYKGFFIASLVLLIVSAITCIISFLGYIFKGYMKRIVATGKNMKKNLPVYAIMIPSMLLLFMFCYYPAIGSINLSFYNYTSAVPRMEWNSFSHYIEIFTSADTWVMFGNTMFFLVFDLILAFVPPLIFAFFLTVMRSKKYSGIIRTLLFLTSIVPGITSILIWKEAFFATEGGLLNSILGIFGLKAHWLTDANLSRWSLVLMGFPFIGSYLIFYGAMMNIPSSYYEAAELDGITVVKRFFKIDLPLIIPQLKYVFIMTFIHSIQNFSRIYVLYGQTGTSYVPKTLIYEMYCLFKSTPVDYGRAAAYATIIFILLFGFTFLAFRTKRRDMEA